MKKSHFNAPAADFLTIGIGQFSHFFTLRLCYMKPIHIRGEGPMGGAIVNGVYQGTVEWEWTSEHMFNLSQSYDEAYAKAHAYAEQHGYSLEAHGTAGEQLASIHRRDREQIAHDNLMAAQERDQWLFTWTDVASPVFHGGKYAGKSIYDVVEFDRDYIEWYAAQGESLLQLRCQVLLERLPAPEKRESAHVGTEGDRLTLTLTVVMKRHIEGMYGVSTMYKMVDADGNVFVTFYSGVKFRADQGETVTVKATVKGHDEYRDEKQTKLTRIVWA